MRVLVLTALVVVAAATENTFRLPSPYSYNCENNFCVQIDRNQATEQQSLEQCQLACGQYGALWPQPTGEVQLSKNVVRFNPYNMRVTKIAASNQKVADMLEESTRYFKRNIHFMHPEFPAQQKTPYTEEEQIKYNDRELFSEDFNNQDRRFQKQQRQNQFSSSNNFNQQTNNEFSNFDQKLYENWERYSPFKNMEYNAGTERQNINVEITVTDPSERLTLDTDESYNLVVQTQNDITTVTILATTYYGARHALETLSQLIAYDDNNNALMIVDNAKVNDKPQYKYRGLMLDTGRNFYTKEEIMSLLDSMSQNKMNVLHWHITDSASFPLYSDRVPQMAYYGAYTPRKVYYPEQIREIVEYAKLRGIMVIPELDGPAHTGAGWEWGANEGKGSLVLCTSKSLKNEPWFSVSKEPPSGQLNPVNPEVYNVLGELYRDMVEYFDPEMIHMGGDDVSFKCWNSAEEIKTFLQENNREVSSRENFELWNTYQSNAFSKLQEASRGRQITPIIHSSSFARNYIDKETYIIQLGEDANDAQIADYVNNGYKVIFSNPDQWRLDCSGTAWFGEKAEKCPQITPTWKNFYSNSPLDMLYNLGISNARSERPTGTQQQQTTEKAPREYVMGGVASMWSFETDGKTFQPKTWPKVSALAERLWSDPLEPTNKPFDTTQKRLNIQRARMVDRGIKADPLQPEFCMRDESACYNQEQYNLRSNLGQ